MLAIETLVPLNCSAVVFVSNLIADYVNPLETHTIVGRSPVYQRCAEQEDLWSIRRPTGPLVVSSFASDFKF